SPAPLSAQETVERLLRLHFRDGRTRVNAEAQLLVAELLKVFVRGERAEPRAPAEPRAGLPLLPRRRSRTAAVLPRLPGGDAAGPGPSHRPSPSCARAAEAAARAARQAQAEELDKVETEQLEKVLPQLVGAR
ncbi:CENPX protein, partial [Panurus biarmicus]|nr:CENPX protein [Panurus biarmicus]